MSQPSAIAKHIPHGGSAIVKSFSEGGEFMDETMEISAYGSVNIAPEDTAKRERYHANVCAECAKLMSVFPMQDRVREQAFYTILYNAIEESCIPISRLRDSIDNLIRTNHYRSFSPADVLGYDKKITLATRIDSLKRAVRIELPLSEIVIIYVFINGTPKRMFGVKSEVELSLYKDRIIGVWDDNEHYWKWVGSFKDPTIEARMSAFDEELQAYAELYPEEVIDSFRKVYNRIVPPGDTLFYETKMSWDMGDWLKAWYNKHLLKEQQKRQENENV